MLETQRTADHLLLLVGSNPLPNYLAALILKPKGIQLFYSRETENVKDYLKKAILKKLPETIVTDKPIADATNAKEVAKAFSFIAPDAHLHYTGGTKIMAAHARLAFKNGGGKDNQASYLDERESVLRFDDGYRIELSKHPLNLALDDILHLHGINHAQEDTAPRPFLPTEEDAQKIAISVFKQPELAQKLYALNRNEQGKELSFSEAKEKPAVLDELLNLELSIPHFPENSWSCKTYKKWLNFLGGGWLEQWVGHLVGNLLPGNQSELWVNVKSFEIDVSILRNYRLYIISCTTDAKLGLCKSKLFEVAVRTRQLGGDLARSALVCLLSGSNDDGPLMDQLRNDIGDVWEAPNTPQAFGLDDLKEWAGLNGEAHTDSLQKWLES